MPAPRHRTDPMLHGGPGSLAEQLGRILTDARGDTPRAQLADAAGVHAGTLRELEANHRGDGTPNNPTLKRVEEVGAVYGIEFELVARPVPRTRRRAS